MQSPLEFVQEGVEELPGNGVNCTGSAARLQRQRHYYTSTNHV